MSTYTPNLDLLEKNPTTEGSDLFNVGTMLNDNWDKIDSYVALLAASIAPAYSASSAYAVGAWCTHGGKLWQCATAIGTGGEAWNESHWTAVTAAQLIAAVSAAVEGKAPTSHAASADTYGKGTGTSYGHLKLSDATDDSSDADGGIAATPKAVKAVENTKADKTALATFVRPNLLDNWYFVGGGSQQGGGQFPINTRGQTSYTNPNTGHVYTIDRWKTQKGTVSLTSSGLQLSFTTQSVQCVQIINNGENLYGKKVTLSAIVDGAFMSTVITIPQSPSTGTIGSGLVFPSGIGVYLRLSSDGLYVSFYATSVYTINTIVSVTAIKLELGDTQTLAHQENSVWVLNEIPDYNEQVIRCTELPASPAKVEYGSYTGTGTYGSGNANSLTFPFVPKFVLIKRQSNSQYSIVAANGLSAVYSDYSTSYANNLTWDGMTLEWYNASGANRQLNESGVTYCYVAVG